MRRAFAVLSARYPKLVQSLTALVLVLSLPLLVFAALTVQNLVQKASSSNVVKIVNSSNDPITETTDPVVNLQISLPSDWVLPGSFPKPPDQPDGAFLPIQKAYAQEDQQDTDGTTGGGNQPSAPIQAPIAQPQQPPVNNNPPPSVNICSRHNGDCGGCLSESACAYTGGQCIDVNPNDPNVVNCPSGRSSWYWANCQTNACAAPQQPQPTAGQPLAETKHILKSITIENQGDPNSKKTFSTPTEILNLLSTPKQWELKSLEPNQPEATRTVVVTLSDGATTQEFTTSVLLKKDGQSFGTSDVTRAPEDNPDIPPVLPTPSGNLSASQEQILSLFRLCFQKPIQTDPSCKDIDYNNNGVIDGKDYEHFFLIPQPTKYIQFSVRDDSQTLVTNQFDNPSNLIQYNQLGSGQVIIDAARVTGLSPKTEEDDNFVYLDFGSQEISEQQAKEQINAIEPYYLRTMMWLLIQTDHRFPVDPWFVFCDHLSQDKMNMLGVEQTTLIGEDYRQLECSDPPPTIEQIGIGNSHARFVYKKISAKVLLNMLMTWKIQREAQENKNLSENAKDAAFAVIPLFGPIIDEIRNPNPGEDPMKTASRLTTNILTGLIMDVAGGKVIGKVGGVAYKTLKLAGKPITIFGRKIANPIIRRLVTARKITDIALDDAAVSLPFGWKPIGTSSWDRIEAAALVKQLEEDAVAQNISPADLASLTHTLGELLGKTYSPAVIKGLEGRFGQKIGEGVFGFSFRNGNVMTKIFKEVTEADMYQVEFYRKFGGVGGKNGISAFLGEIRDNTGRIVGFQQEFIPNAIRLDEFEKQGGRLTQGEIDEAIKTLESIYDLTELAHGDLAFPTTLHGGNILVQRVLDGETYKNVVRIIDWVGFNIGEVANPRFQFREFENFRKGLQAYVVQ